MKTLQLSRNQAYIVTGPTSGIGMCTALALAAHGTVVLVGRDRHKLDGVQARIVAEGGHAVSIVCDLADPDHVQRAASEIIALDLPIIGLVNNAGVMLSAAGKNTVGWDMTFATNYLGPFAFTEALAPHLQPEANVVFVVSAIEDPERKPAKVVGMRGGRFISIEASARGEWKAGGAKMPGIDAYATSKQCSLAATLMLAKEHPDLHINAVEPGINPATALGGANAFIHFLFGQIISRLPPFRQYRSTPTRAARVITKIVTDVSGKSGVYFDEKGQPMTGSPLAHDPAFQANVVDETRAFLGRG